MRRLLPLLLFSLACNALLPPPTVENTRPPSPSATPAPSLTPSTIPPTATTAPTATSAATWTAAPEYGLRPEDVTFHPDPYLYSGDIASLEVNAEHLNPLWNISRTTAQLHIGDLANPSIARADFSSFGIGGRTQATLQWAWDTTGLEGPQMVVIAIGPAGAGVEAGGDSIAPEDVLTLTVNLRPASERPLPEPLAQWAQAESVCCVFHYLTHTAAARDIARIQTEADAAFAHVEQVLGVTQKDKVGFTLLSRLLGHGGFAANEISLTYIDRNPVGNGLTTVFAHEGTHLLDRQISRVRPVMMTEGLAVYVAGGHFKPEDLERRAAALLVLDDYIPLARLANDFYNAQHEIGYLEGGAFITYLVDTYGWEAFKKFYGAFQPASADAQMLDRGLSVRFGKGLDDLESEWLAHLRSLPPDENEIENLRLTIVLYDTLRRYQSLDDPAAYFLTAWLPEGPQARKRGIVADFVRHPTAPENIALETMLGAAREALDAGDFAQAEALLEAVEAVLTQANHFDHPLAADYLNIVTQLNASGYEAQSIRLEGQTATVTAITDWPTLETLTLTEVATGWQLAGATRFDSRPESSDGIIAPVIGGH
jgi:hypothetical protein